MKKFYIGQRVRIKPLENLNDVPNILHSIPIERYKIWSGEIVTIRKIFDHSIYGCAYIEDSFMEDPLDKDWLFSFELFESPLEEMLEELL